MADTEYTEALTGEEIIVDLLEQVALKLRSDCNLRDSDSYLGGYSAKISIHLEAYGLDTAKVETQLAIGASREDTESEVIHEIIDIPVETDLDAVRDRSDQEIPTLSQETSSPLTPQKRRYTKKIPMGGATGESL